MGQSDSQPKVVLVTGASGFVALNVIQELAKTQHKIRATVRNANDKTKVDIVKRAAQSSKFPIEIVSADLTNADSWIEACRGADIVIHTASPFPIDSPEDPENQLYKPAIQGTKNVLNAAYITNVKRVVVTSSCASVYDFMATNTVFTEKNWNDPEKTTPYAKSKILAERAAWDFVEEKKKNGKNCFELAVINPCFVMGPSLGDSSSLGTSEKMIAGMLQGIPEKATEFHIGYCDVRDVAQAHVRAAFLPEAAGHRHIIETKWASNKQAFDILKNKYENQGFKLSTEFESTPNPNNRSDTTRMTSVLKIKPNSFENSIIDMAESLIKAEQKVFLASILHTLICLKMNECQKTHNKLEDSSLDKLISKNSSSSKDVKSCKNQKTLTRSGMERRTRKKCQKCNMVITQANRKFKYCLWCIELGKIRIEDIEEKNMVKKSDLTLLPRGEIIKTKCLKKLDELITTELNGNNNNLNQFNFPEQFLGTNDLVINLIRDESYEIYKHLTKEYVNQEINALKLISQSTKQLPSLELNSNLLEDLLVSKLVIHLDNHVNCLMNTIRCLPGFDRFSMKDMQQVLSEQLIVIFGLRTLNLFIKDDYFLMLDENIQFSKNVASTLLGESVCQKVIDFFFNLKSMNLTTQELSLLVPFILTMSNENVDNFDLVKEINQNYGRALFSEFALNQRNSNKQFLDFFSDLIKDSSNINKICCDVLIRLGIMPFRN
ncbi:unnamed protein product [Brachionus calyciflorus]|uniref:NAD-dependent epimerase/dehydratase domain-containing protein n=1 Tax=Brachionus calyciflorus TaxID=104777 RepID=A0A813TDJ4_9BILA|nr:unnamed protein product [Brachionus calyciflorus]